MGRTVRRELGMDELWIKCAVNRTHGSFKDGNDGPRLGCTTNDRGPEARSSRRLARRAIRQRRSRRTLRQRKPIHRHSAAWKSFNRSARAPLATAPSFWRSTPISTAAWQSFNAFRRGGRLSRESLNAAPRRTQDCRRGDRAAVRLVGSRRHHHPRRNLGNVSELGAARHMEALGLTPSVRA